MPQIIKKESKDDINQVQRELNNQLIKIIKLFDFLIKHSQKWYTERRNGMQLYVYRYQKGEPPLISGHKLEVLGGWGIGRHMVRSVQGLKHKAFCP